MANHSKGHELRAAITAALIQLDRGEGYKRSQREATAGKKSREARRRQAGPGFMGRVTRLLRDA